MQLWGVRRVRAWKLLLQVLRWVPVLLKVLRRWVVRMCFKRWLRAVLIHPRYLRMLFCVVALVWLMIWLPVVVVSL